MLCDAVKMEVVTNCFNCNKIRGCFSTDIPIYCPGYYKYLSFPFDAYHRERCYGYYSYVPVCSNECNDIVIHGVGWYSELIKKNPDFYNK